MAIGIASLVYFWCSQFDLLCGFRRLQRNARRCRPPGGPGFATLASAPSGSATAAFRIMALCYLIFFFVTNHCSFLYISQKIESDFNSFVVNFVASGI